MADHTPFGEPLLQSSSAKLLVARTEARLASIGRAKNGAPGEARFEALRALSILQLELNQLDKAEKGLRKSIKLSQSLYGEHSLEYLSVTNYMGVLFFKRGDKKQAEATFKDLVKVLSFGRAGPKGNKRDIEIGATNEKAGDPARAVNELLNEAKRNYSAVLSALGRHDEAEEMLGTLAPQERGGGGSGIGEPLSAAIAKATIGREKDGKTIQRKRQSLRKRLSLLIGGSSGTLGISEDEEDDDNPSGLEFFFDMPLGKSSTIMSREPKAMTGDEAESMKVPIVDVLDHIATILADARRQDHIELLFRTALSGQYGTLSKLEEQRISVRLALLLSYLPEYLAEATSLLQRSLLLSEELFGTDDAQVGVISGDLATLIARKGDLETAETYFTRSLKILRGLNFRHAKEEIIYDNMSVLIKAKGGAADAGEAIAGMCMAIDDDWLLQQSDTNLTPDALAKSLRAALLLEKNEKGTPGWYNWRENERKKALLAYMLEVLRDAGRDWDEEMAPKYLTIVLEVQRQMGTSLACAAAGGGSGMSARAPPAKKHSERKPSAVGRKSASASRDEIRHDHESKSSSRRSRHRSTTPNRFIDADVDMRDLLSRFFAEFSPSKNDPSFIEKTLDRYKSRKLALIEALEVKYNVTFNSDGSWVEHASRRGGGGGGGTRPRKDRHQKSRSDSKPERRGSRNERSDRRSSKAVPADDRDESGILDPNVSLRATLLNFYKLYAPDRIDAVDTMLSHFKGRHKALFTALQNKYSVQFQRDGTAVSLEQDNV